MAQPRPEDPRFTYGDYVQWSGDERWELIDGVARMMSPAPSRWHQQVVSALGEQVGPELRRRGCSPFVAPFDVRLPTSDEPDEVVVTVVQPDYSVICDSAKLDDAGCRGAPDWIVEVLSPSTTGHDRIAKRDLYERHGVREYWIVDPIDRDLWIYRLDESGRFGDPAQASAEGVTAVGIFPDLAVDWDRVFEA